MKRVRKKKAKLTAEQIDAIHDAGTDMSKYTEWSKAKRPNLEIRRVNVDFPKWIIDGLDKAAKHRGITRQAIIKYWISEKLMSGDDKKIA
jgi:hypothetical protein